MLSESVKSTKKLLDSAAIQFNHPSFIEKDPISIPRKFSRLQDIEITGFWTAMLSWGQRVTIINKANELLDLMDHAPYDFIINHKESEREPFLQFKHRTFNDIDTLYFLEWLQWYYQEHKSLEEAFTAKLSSDRYLVGVNICVVFIGHICLSMP